jgi:quercetin dioxygenase-like cupin family protein
MAVLQGNPGGTGLFTVRLRFPNGYRLAPHTHPTDENVTVISGTFLVGMGETADWKSTM